MRVTAPRRAVVLALLLAVIVAAPDRARGADPPTEPILRIEPEMHGTRITRATIDAAGKFVATGSNDKTVRVWDLATGRLRRIIRPPIGPTVEGQIYTVAMSPDGATLAAAGWTGFEWDRSNSIYLFDRATGRMLRRITGL